MGGTVFVITAYHELGLFQCGTQDYRNGTYITMCQLPCLSEHCSKDIINSKTCVFATIIVEHEHYDSFADITFNANVYPPRNIMIMNNKSICMNNRNNIDFLPASPIIPKYLPYNLTWYTGRWVTKIIIQKILPSYLSLYQYYNTSKNLITAYDYRQLIGGESFNISHINTHKHIHEHLYEIPITALPKSITNYSINLNEEFVFIDISWSNKNI